MINRQHRFHGHGSLRFVYQRGASVRGAHHALRYCKNPKRHTYRLAVVVSRRVHKSAVVRNRIRRRLYEAVRLEAGGFSQPYDLVFTVYDAQVAEMTPAALRASVRDQLVKAGVLPAAQLPVTPPDDQIISSMV